MRRRDFITAIAALVSQATLAQAETYPSRPVRLIVGFPPGGTTDVVARVIGKRLSERFGVPFVVENSRVPAPTSPPSRCTSFGRRPHAPRRHTVQHHQCIVLRQARLRFRTRYSAGRKPDPVSVRVGSLSRLSGQDRS